MDDVDGVKVFVADRRVAVVFDDHRRATGPTTIMTSNEHSELHRHMSCATAREDVVSSSPVDDTDETLTRSHLSSGIVDERQTHVWPEFLESAHTSEHLGAVVESLQEAVGTLRPQREEILE